MKQHFYFYIFLSILKNVLLIETLRDSRINREFFIDNLLLKYSGNDSYLMKKG